MTEKVELLVQLTTSNLCQGRIEEAGGMARVGAC